jgi:hypothetical protein
MVTKQAKVPETDTEAWIFVFQIKCLTLEKNERTVSVCQFQGPKQGWYKDRQTSPWLCTWITKRWVHCFSQQTICVKTWKWHHHTRYQNRLEGSSDLCSCLTIENSINTNASHGLHIPVTYELSAPEEWLPSQPKKKCWYTLVFFDMPTNFTIDVKS